MSNKAKHTAGEWKVIFWGGKIEIRDANNNHIAFVKGDEDQVTPNKETRDIAKLIAAAPKMLDALRRLLNCPALNLEGLEREDNLAILDAMDAINKATE